MSEPTANEADVAEQQQPATPEDAAASFGAPALPDEAEVADVLEQYADVPGSDDDYPAGAAGGDA